MTAQYRDDPVLGRVRLCPGCGDEWPFDDEFWHMRNGRLDGNRPARCRACCADYTALRRRARMTFVRDGRGRRLAPPDRCGRRLADGGFCGRLPAHRYGCRSVEALEDDARRQYVRRNVA